MNRRNSLDDTGAAMRGPTRHRVPLDVEVLDLRCECGRRSCRQTMRVSAPTLSWARSRGLLLVCRGHFSADDVVVEDVDSFVLVRPRPA
jgi:hypothetical protein